MWSWLPIVSRLLYDEQNVRADHHFNLTKTFSDGHLDSSCQHVIYALWLIIMTCLMVLENRFELGLGQSEEFQFPGLLECERLKEHDKADLI